MQAIAPYAAACNSRARHNTVQLSEIWVEDPVIVGRLYKECATMQECKKPIATVFTQLANKKVSCVER